jgi:hypothetical protein
MQIGLEAQVRANIINRAAKGWQLAFTDGNLFDEGWLIEKTEGLFAVPHTNKDATEFVVTRAWDEDPLALLALDFLRLNSPFRYVEAIKIAHDSA